MPRSSSVAPGRPDIGAGSLPSLPARIYLSDHSKMNFAENGVRIDDPSLRLGTMPHLQKARGAVRNLHVAFG